MSDLLREPPIEIAQALLDLSHRVASDQRPVVRDHPERLRATTNAQPFDSAEQTSLVALVQQIGERLSPPAPKPAAAEFSLHVA